MQESEIRLLALNPGSRYVGTAVFHGDELVEWEVRSIREKSMKEKKEKLRTLLSGVTDAHGVNCLSVKGFHRSRTSKQLRELTRDLKAWALRRDLPVTEYTIKEIEASLLSSGRGSKRRLMEEVAARYPFLYPELEKERKNRNPYLVRMFEAVALGIGCVSDPERLKGRGRISTNHGNKEE